MCPLDEATWTSLGSADYFSALRKGGQIFRSITSLCQSQPCAVDDLHSQTLRQVCETSSLETREAARI